MTSFSTMSSRLSSYARHDMGPEHAIWAAVMAHRFLGVLRSAEQDSLACSSIHCATKYPLAETAGVFMHVTELRGP